MDKVYKLQAANIPEATDVDLYIHASNHDSHTGKFRHLCYTGVRLTANWYCISAYDLYADEFTCTYKLGITPQQCYEVKYSLEQKSIQNQEKFQKVGVW